jgi:PAS domain S-box-containing protein
LRRTFQFALRDLREILGTHPVAILAGVGAILVALVVMITVTLLADNAAESRREELSADVEPYAAALGNLETRLLSLSTDLRAYVLTSDAAFRDRYQQQRSFLVSDISRLQETTMGERFEPETRQVVRDLLAYLTSADTTFRAAERGDGPEAERLIADQNTPRLDVTVASISAAQEEASAESARLRDRIRNIDRVERYVLLLAGPLGVIAAGVLVWLALTNQRLLRNATKEQARFTTMVGSISRYGICQMNARGEIEYCNPAAAEMLGYEVDDLIGRSLHDTIHHTRADGSPFPASDSQVLGVLGTGLSYKGQDSLVRADGEFLPVDVTSEPIRVNGRVTGAVVAFEDMTQRLKQDQFRQQFVSFASHELRTPLMIMSGYVQLLAKRLRADPDAFDERSREAITELEEGTARMRRITEVVLDLTRIQSGQVLPIEADELNLREVVDREVEAVRANHPEARIATSYPNGSAQVRSDEARLTQALANLLDNAAKYGGDPPEIEVQVGRNGSHVSVSVRDHGPGIAADEQPLVFEQFYRSSRATGKPGLGVGLFITKRIVEGIGGTLSFESRPGDGTTFTLTLPAGTDNGG